MEKVSHRRVIARANRYMVDHADHRVAYVWHPASNARKLLDYACKREVKGIIHVCKLESVFARNEGISEEVQI